jgi:hypothetical protein
MGYKVTKYVLVIFIRNNGLLYGKMALNRMLPVTLVYLAKLLTVSRLCRETCMLAVYLVVKTVYCSKDQI